MIHVYGAGHKNVCHVVARLKASKLENDVQFLNMLLSLR